MKPFQEFQFEPQHPCRRELVSSLHVPLRNELDQWMRRRIRMCYWKQWRTPKRRREMLIKLGVPRRQAIRHARSRKGPLHMTKTIASGVGMTYAWLYQQGLLSLKTLWASLPRIRPTAGCGPACPVVWGGLPERDVLTRFQLFLEPVLSAWSITSSE